MSGVWGPTRAELDRTPPLSDARPARSYVICSTPRSGSGLLARGLAAAGSGGIPAEYLNPRQRGPLAERWQTGPSIERYAEALRRHRTDGEGTFGIKIHWNQLALLAQERAQGGAKPDPAALLEELFPGSVFIHIYRLELTAQAVSLWRANFSGIWAEEAKKPAAAGRPPRYSYRAIHACRLQIAEHEAEWTRFFRSSGIEPVEVVYEELCAAFGTECARVLAAIGSDARAAPPEADSRIQSDASTAQAIARYERDAARRVDPPLTARALSRLQRLVS